VRAEQDHERDEESAGFLDNLFKNLLSHAWSTKTDVAWLVFSKLFQSLSAPKGFFPVDPRIPR
jgi:hypothetical protein